MYLDLENRWQELQLKESTQKATAARAFFLMAAVQPREYEELYQVAASLARTQTTKLLRLLLMWRAVIGT